MFERYDFHHPFDFNRFIYPLRWSDQLFIQPDRVRSAMGLRLNITLRLTKRTQNARFFGTVFFRRFGLLLLVWQRFSN